VLAQTPPISKWILRFGGFAFAAIHSRRPVSFAGLFGNKKSTQVHSFDGNQYPAMGWDSKGTFRGPRQGFRSAGSLVFARFGRAAGERNERIRRPKQGPTDRLFCGDRLARREAGRYMPVVPSLTAGAARAIVPR
jgi:hypothetical protein